MVRGKVRDHTVEARRLSSALMEFEQTEERVLTGDEMRNLFKQELHGVILNRE